MGHPYLLLVLILLLASFGLLLLCAPHTYAQEPTPEPTVYVVQPGDTLSAIAQRFDTTAKAIAVANEIEDPSLIRTGQKLVIPEPVEAGAAPLVSTTSPLVRIHPVRAGETILGLAFRYGTSIWGLRDANTVHRLDLLWPGQELIIPSPILTTTHTPTFPHISTSPDPMLPGATMAVVVVSDEGLDLQGEFLGQDLEFVARDGRQWALVGVDALTPKGDYPLRLTATEVDRGDRLALQDTVVITGTKFSTYNVPVPTDRQALLDPALVEAERRKVNQVFSQMSDEQLWQGLFSYPLQGEFRTTAPFGQRRSYAGGPVTSYHTGHDYGADTGRPVYAPITGTVALAEPLDVRGKVVILDHGLGVFTGFWHLSQIDVEAGQVVGRGERVGLVGNTGLSTGPHLHWEMRVHNVPVDPRQWTRRAFPW
jgi:murein DD-endopeptidase MepM/ murein hydrolase activator NlpD